MEDLEAQLRRILGDPEQMAQISSLAQSLMGGGEVPPPSSPLSRPEPEAGPGRLPGVLSGPASVRSGGDKAALLEALGPYLSEKRRRKLKRAMRLAQMARLARFAMGEAGNGEAL